MPSQRPTFYVSTPIYYVNDRPHIGHVYTTTVADVIARYHRMRGSEVFFLTGTDEHAAKVVDAAAERGLSAQEWADRNAAVFEKTFSDLGLSHDDFVRTTQDRHRDRVVEYVGALLETGDVYEGEYEGWYDAGQEEYLPDNKAKEFELKSPINGKPLVRKKEKNWFFRLSAYRDRLVEHMERNPGCVRPDARRNEVLGRLRAGLEDVPISRTGASGWGIAMPGDPDQTIYVWIDALCNYLTTVDDDEHRHLWPADVHLIGKDILWFHAVIWPAMLMALGRPLPGCVYAHSFWISEGQKMSKTLGNFVDLETLERYAGEFGLDSLRWFLATRGPMGATDSDFAHERFVEVYNADLANSVGNCAARVGNMIARYLDGVLPDPPTGEEDELARGLRTASDGMLAELEGAFATYSLAAASRAALDVIGAVDGYIEQTRPFSLAKEPDRRAELEAVLYRCAESLRIASLGLWPFLPERIELFWKRFGLDYEGDAGRLAELARWGGLPSGTVIEKGDPLFPRVKT